MKFQNYKIQITRETSYKDIEEFEVNARQKSNDDHKLLACKISIDLKWEVEKQRVSSAEKHREIFTSIEDFDDFINSLISSNDNCDANFREFVFWLERRLIDARNFEANTY